MKYKKVAIVHDVFIEWGGAERVLLSFLKLFRDADVYIPLLSEEAKRKLQTVTSGKIHTSWFNFVPFISSASVLLKPFLYLYWENLNLNKYDLVISSSHSFSSKSILTGVNTFHISYIHTPPRYLYTEYNETRIIKFGFFKFLLSPVMNWLRIQDFIGAQRPDLIIANSQVVQNRVKKYYRRDSKVVYPPVLLPTLKEKSKNSEKKYFLCFSRLAKQKGIDLAIKTFNRLKLPLMVVGKGAEDEYLKSIAGPTITFLGFVRDEELVTVFSQAHALINCAQEEDFGLVNVEALHFGVPIIGYNSGSIGEIVSDKTGVLFSEYSINGLEIAIRKFQKKRFSSLLLTKEAKSFSEKNFHKKITQAIDEFR